MIDTRDQVLRKILRIFVVFMIICMIAVPALGKADLADLNVEKQARAPQKVDAEPVALKAGGQGAEKVSDDADNAGNAVARSEKAQERLNLNNAFRENEEGIKLEKADGKMKVTVPAGQEVKEQARIKLKDMSGEEIGELIADIDLTDSEKARIEKGEASLRSIKSLRLVSKEKEVTVKDSKGNSHKMKAQVDVGLNSINEDSGLDITTSNDLDDVVETRFNEVAEKNKVKLGNRGGVMKVDKINLRNGEEVDNAKIVFKVEPEWVGEGNVNNVRIMRMDDDGFTEMLPTDMAGVDEDGLLIFEGDSQNGLSTFAVFMTENITDTQDTSFDFGSLKSFILPLLIIVTVGAAFVGSMMRKEHD